MAFRPFQSIAKSIARRRSFPSLATYAGAKFVLDPRNWIDTRLAAGLPYEAEQIARAMTIIADEKIDTFIDVGANMGLYTVLIGRLPTVSQVLAFEPVRRNYNQLLGNVFANRLDAKVDAYRIALSDKPGQFLMYVNPMSTGVSRLDLAGCERDVAVFTDRETVQVARFDDVCALNGRRIYVKIDVEGNAARVLAGMEALFPHNTVFLQVEVVEDEDETIDRLARSRGLILAPSIGGDHYYAPASLAR